MSPPAAPPPTEERLFTDWSNEGSPRERTSQCVQSNRSIESRRTEQITREPGYDEIRRHTLSDVSTTTSVQVQRAPISVCQSTIDYPACRCWTVKCSTPIETNHIQPYIGHTQLNIRQASPQCI